MAQLAHQRSAGRLALRFARPAHRRLGYRPRHSLPRVARSHSVRARTTLLAVSVLAGAAAGEWLVRLLYGGHDSLAS
jgi:hypothetical protein